MVVTVHPGESEGRQARGWRVGLSRVVINRVVINRVVISRVLISHVGR